MIKIINVNNFDINGTITCGQIFRYIEEDDNSYTVILSDRVINIKLDGNSLLIKSSNEENLEKIIREYFDLDRDYNKLNQKLLDIDPNLKELIDNCIGFKIIKQPKFETLISYILSSNNGVPQIRSALNNISIMYGKKIIFEEKEYYLFPNVYDMKDITTDILRELKVGFRDKYIYEIINKIINNEFDLDLIDEMSTNNAMDYLMNNKGIGEKVASCILLFSYSKFDVFPVDTWVKKYMFDEYGIKDIKKIRKFTEEKYKDLSGLVIQYMFHSKRNKK